LLFAAYFLEAGFVLVVAPWSAFWEHNRFAELHRSVEALVSSPFVRGGVSGIGVITIVAGLAELGSAIVSRRREPAAGPPQAGQ
jgi:hypothetical protein